MRKLENVFSLKTTVVCLTAYLSFPRKSLTTVNSRLNFQVKGLGRGRVSEPASRENFYPLKLPTELYLALIERMAKTKLSKGDCLIDMLTETAYREGLLPEEHYRFLKLKYGTKTVLDKVLEGREKREVDSVKVEVSSAKLEVHKSTVEVKRHVDYSKFTDKELLEAYRKAILTNDIVTPNLIQGEARKRGYRFKGDDSGNVQVITLKGCSE